MTIHEAIEHLKSLPDHCKTMRESGEVWARDVEAMDIVIASLRGPTREQVEAWPGCSYCQEGAYSDAAFDVMCRGEEADFCKFCGRPLTDEAVDIVMKRLEELYETE